MSVQVVPIMFGLIIFQTIRGTSCTSGCSRENISCSDIRVADGFRFKHKCREGDVISVESTNMTAVGSANLRTQSFEYMPPIVKMDNSSVVTENCQDLKITCAVDSTDFDEKCRYFQATGENNSSLLAPGDHIVSPLPYDNSTNHWSPACVWIAPLVTIVVVFIGHLLTSWCYWKKKNGTHQKTTYFRYVVTCSWIKEILNKSNRNQDGSGIPMAGTRDLEGQINGDIRNGEDPHGSGENGQHVLQSVNSGDLGAPVITTPSDHSPMNGYRNKREDPGGINQYKDSGIMRELDGGGVSANHQPEEQSLLPDQRAASGGCSNMVDEAVASVNKLSFNRDQVCRCSASHNADVESTYPGKPT